MKKTIFTGAGVALVTPMHADGSVNFEKLDELINWQIENGTDAIIACGTTGESATLTHEEHVQVISRTVKTVAGRVPVIAGTGSNHTDYAISLSKEAESAGVDALLVVTPYYNKTSQAGLIRHYTAIADSVSLPIILYNVPSRTGVNILPETYAVLAEHENIAAIKEANGNIAAAAKTLSLCGDKLDLYSGNDDQITPLMSLGAKGVISVLSNVAPRLAHDIAASYLEGDVKKSAELQIGNMDLIQNLFIDVNPIPVKEALNMMGMEVGECRLPLCSLSEAHHEALKKSLQQAGLL